MWVSHSGEYFIPLILFSFFLPPPFCLVSVSMNFKNCNGGFLHYGGTLCVLLVGMNLPSYIFNYNMVDSTDGGLLALLNKMFGSLFGFIYCVPHSASKK